MGWRVGVDVGGTFTDLVALDGERILTAKVPTTPADQSGGVLKALDAAALEAVDAFAHGMTVATNALLERRGARTALVTTHGFRDVIEIARQARPSLYVLTRRRPAPLVPRERRFTVRERMGPEGVLVALDPDSLALAVRRLREAEVEAVAVCLLFAFLHPAHEREVGEAIRAALPDVHVSLSSEVLPAVREYERFATTTADAYLAPRLAAYLARLSAHARDRGLPEPLVMQSSGGVLGAAAAGSAAAACVLSGPAGGVVGAAHVAGRSGHADVLTFDMGGTSTDVAPVVGGEVRTSTASEVAGVPLGLPMVDVHTVSAGGGSIAWVDPGGALRVGPRSAGADPGPVAYGRGGAEPTVTDANLLCGLLGEDRALGDEVTLDRGLAQAALERLGEALGLDAVAAALGVIAVANAEMSRALRVVSVQRGLDPRGFALVAFGGAGGLHACALAEELGMGTVLLPRAGGVLSALGLVLSDLRRDYSAPLPAPLADVDPEGLERAFAALEATAREDLAEPRLERRADLRYRGQSFELTVAADDPGALAPAFHALHAERSGYAMEEEPLELVSLRLVATVAVPRPDLPEPPAPEDPPAPARRRATLDGKWAELPVLARGDLGRGSRVAGPALVEFEEATALVRPGWRGRVDAAGTLVLAHGDDDDGAA